MRRTLALCALLALSFACESGRVTKKQLNDACAKNLDCLYGLECVDGAAPTDGGIAKAGKVCQYKSFGDCESEPDGGVALNGQSCLSGQRCRDGKCTVQCAAKADCKDTEVCKIGICQKGSGRPVQCYDNRDCPWPETCFYGQCVTRTETLRCQTDLDCGIGYRCINGRCQ